MIAKSEQHKPWYHNNKGIEPVIIINWSMEDGVCDRGLEWRDKDGNVYSLSDVIKVLREEQLENRV